MTERDGFYDMYKLLLVDDEDIIRSGLKLILEKELNGLLQILEASNGRDAINKINEYKPEIVITDVRMPHLDGLGLIKRISKDKTHNPIFIILSGYDDFYYAKQAIEYGVKDYLLKPVVKIEIIKLLTDIIDELDINTKDQETELLKKGQIEEEIEYIKGKYFNELIKNKNIDKDAILKRLSTLGVNLNYNFFTIMIVEYRRVNSINIENLFDNERNNIKNAVIDGIQNIIQNSYYFSDSKMRMVFLLCENDNFFGSMESKRIYEKIYESGSRDFDIEFFMAVGSKAQGILNIPESYLNALEVLNYKAIKGSCYLVFEKKMKFKNIEIPFLAASLVKITTKTELCKYNEIVDLIDQMFLQLDLEKASISKLISFYNEFTKYIYNYFTNIGLDFSLVFEQNENFFKDINFFWSLEHIQIYIKKCLFKICDIITSLKSIGHERRVIDQIVSYLKLNFDKDINLNTIADVFNKNNCYLSVLFKKEIGINFNDYLTSLRIEKAKELLMQDDLNIQELSLKVGYPNSKHFSSVFKSVTGVSPKQYRERILRKSY